MVDFVCVLDAPDDDPLVSVAGGIAGGCSVADGGSVEGDGVGSNPSGTAVSLVPLLGTGDCELFVGARACVLFVGAGACVMFVGTGVGASDAGAAVVTTGAMVIGADVVIPVHS